MNFCGEKKKRKTQKQTNWNKQKRQGRKGYTNNPEVSALTLSGTPWCNGGLSKGRTIRKVMGRGGGGGLGNFQLARICFFFRSQLVQEFFFRWSFCANFFFFFRQILLFFEQWNLESLSMFLGFINYSTLTTDQKIQATLMQNLFENVHTVREHSKLWLIKSCFCRTKSHI